MGSLIRVSVQSVPLGTAEDAVIASEAKQSRGIVRQTAWRTRPDGLAKALWRASVVPPASAGLPRNDEGVAERLLIREIKDRLFSGFALGSGMVVIGFLVLGLTLVFVKGFHAISWRFLLTPMREGGISGGILYQVLGTVILVLTTLVIVTPISIGVALVRSVCLRRPVLKRFFALFLYTLNAMPSVLFGIFGFFFFVKYLGWGKSWLTGGILLSMMILPVTSLSLSEGMDRIPKDYTENALSLGLTRTALIHAVLLPQSFSGFVSGVLLGLARAAGETAPIMFTATIFSGATFPKAIQDSPVLTLPYHILNLAQETYQPQALENAWASALVLIAGVIILSLCALPFRIRLHEEAKS